MFNLIPDWNKKNLRCYFCGETRSVKYATEIHDPAFLDGSVKVCVCNRCVAKIERVTEVEPKFTFPRDVY